MKNVLFTGACGFIGSNVLNYFLQKYPNVYFYNIDKLDYCSNQSNVLANDKYTFIHGNICDAFHVKHILNEYEIDTLFHFAAQTHVDNSFGNSLQFTEDNIKGTHTLLECAINFGKIEKFIHMSTDEVYGEVDIHHTGCTEERSLLNPTNPYAATKAAAEFLCRSYYHSFNIPIVIVRCNNVYGPNQYAEKLIPKFIKHLQNNEKMPIHGTGETRRNFIHVYDVATAIDIIHQKGSINEIYNIGTSNEYSVLEIAKMLVEKYKPNENYVDWIEFVSDRKFNDFRYSICSKKLRQLGWCETHNGQIPEC
jgi:dTDP-glucose 4,6-dehydratase